MGERGFVVEGGAVEVWDGEEVGVEEVGVEEEAAGDAGGECIGDAQEEAEEEGRKVWEREIAEISQAK